MRRHVAFQEEEEWEQEARRECEFVSRKGVVAGDLASIETSSSVQRLNVSHEMSQ